MISGKFVSPYFFKTFHILSKILSCINAYLRSSLGQCILAEPTDVRLTATPVDGMRRSIHIGLPSAGAMFSSHG